jgi:DNA-directed RNA polymerase specialized sigma24 family protein
MTAAGDDEKVRRFRDAALPCLDDVFTLARYLLRNEADAEDAVQECYLRALRHFDSYRGPAMKPWLLTILRNVCKAEFARRSAVSAPSAGKDDEQAADPQPIWQEPPPSPERNCCTAGTDNEYTGSLPRCRRRSAKRWCCGTSTICPIARLPRSPAFPSAR